MDVNKNKQIMARNIKKYVERKGVSNHQLCDDLGFKYTTFMDWIRGASYPRIGKIEAMANYFGCEKSDLIEAKEEEPIIKDELTLRKEKFMARVKQMSEAELEKLEQILRIVENTK